MIYLDIMQSFPLYRGTDSHKHWQAQYLLPTQTCPGESGDEPFPQTTAVNLVKVLPPMMLGTELQGLGTGDNEGSTIYIQVEEGGGGCNCRKTCCLCFSGRLPVMAMILTSGVGFTFIPEQLETAEVSYIWIAPSDFIIASSRILHEAAAFEIELNIIIHNFSWPILSNTIST